MKKIFFAGLLAATVFAVSPISAPLASAEALPSTSSISAMSDEQLVALLTQLIQIVQQLQTQISSQRGGQTENANASNPNAGTNANGSWCYTFNMNLKIGNQGPAVSALKTALIYQGVLAEKNAAISDTPNVFDETTASAVSAFQEKYASEILAPSGLSNGTGFLGASTRAKLNQLYGCGSNFDTNNADTRNKIFSLINRGNLTAAEKQWIHNLTGGSLWKNLGFTEEEMKKITSVLNLPDNPISTTQPSITSVYPNSASSGMTVVVYGNKLNSTVTNMVSICSNTSCGNYNGVVSADGNKVTFTVPVIPAGTYNLNIIDLVANGGSTSVVPFTVTSSGTSATQPSITVLSPNGGEVFTPSATSATMLVRWTNPVGFSSSNSTVTINMCTVGAQTTTCPASGSTNMVSGLTNTGQYQANIWANGSPSPAGKYILNITATRSDGSTNAFGSSASYFTITSPTSTVKPSITSISQSSGPAGTRVVIYGENFCKTAKNVVTFLNPTTDSGDSNPILSYDEKMLTFVVPALVPGTYQVLVESSLASGQANPVPCPTSNSWLFTVTSSTSTTQPSITVLSPNGGESWAVGEKRTVGWSTSGITGTYAAIYLAPADDLSKAVIYDQPFLSAGSQTVTVRNPSEFISYSPLFSSSNKFKIIICAGANYNYPNCSYSDSSDSPFTITAPTTTASSCTDSDGGQNPNVAGLTDGRVNGLGSYFNDSSVSSYGGQCSGDACTSVAEGYCTSDGKVSNTLMSCSTGYSVNGACAAKPVTAQPSIKAVSPNSGQNISTAYIQGVGIIPVLVQYIINNPASGSSGKVEMNLMQNNTKVSSIGTNTWTYSGDIANPLSQNYRNWLPGLYSWTPTNVSAGSGYSVRYVLYDSNGSVTSTADSDPFNIISGTSATQPLVASCSPTPATATLSNGSATITWISSVTGGSGTYQYSWSMYNDGAIANGAVKSPTATYTYAGEKQAAVRVTDGTSTAYGTCSATIQAPPTTTTIVTTPTVTISATPNPVPYNTAPSISWTSTGATNCTATSGNWTTANSISGTTVSGQKTGAVQTSSATYGIACTSSTGQAATNYVTVGAQAAPVTTTPTTPTGNLSITPSVTSTPSGGSVMFSFGTHSDAVSAKLYLPCPSGVTATFGSETTNICNTYRSFTTIPTGGLITFTNTTAQAQNISPNFYEYRSANPNYAYGISTQITVNPTSSSNTNDQINNMAATLEGLRQILESLKSL